MSNLSVSPIVSRLSLDSDNTLKFSVTEKYSKDDVVLDDSCGVGSELSGTLYLI